MKRSKFRRTRRNGDSIERFYRKGGRYKMTKTLINLNEVAYV